MQTSFSTIAIAVALSAACSSAAAACATGEAADLGGSSDEDARPPAASGTKLPPAGEPAGARGSSSSRGDGGTADAGQSPTPAAPCECVPGVVELTVAGCSVAGTSRQRTCAPTCVWSTYGACGPPAIDAVVEVSPASSTVVDVPLTLSLERTMGRVDYAMTCPLSGLLAERSPYGLVEVRNTTGKMAEAVVSISYAVNPGSSAPFTILRYANLPLSDAARLACVGKPYVSQRVDLPPGASAWFLVQPHSTHTAQPNWMVRVYNELR